MQHITSENIQINAPTAVTIGKFDGLHTGHMRLLDELKNIANTRKLATVVLSFSPHPLQVLTGQPLPLILTPDEKLHLLKQSGIDFYIEYPFTHKFAQMPPEHFATNILHDRINCRALVVGAHFRFGKNGAGDVVLAQNLGDNIGYTLHALPDVTMAGVKISSANLRKLVSEKDFEKFKLLAGRDFFLMGKIIHGDKNGRKIGFPTANIAPQTCKVMPPHGVYATTAYVDGTAHPAVTSIGGRPTLNNDNPTIETHLINFDQEIYGKTIRIHFHKWMRNQEKFADMASLGAQLAKDVTNRT